MAFRLYYASFKSPQFYPLLLLWLDSTGSLSVSNSELLIQGVRGILGRSLSPVLINAILQLNNGEVSDFHREGIVNEGVLRGKLETLSNRTGSATNKPEELNSSPHASPSSGAAARLSVPAAVLCPRPRPEH